MNMKLVGGVLLVVGSSIGGGMLALPIATAEMGFIYSSVLLFICWFLMTASAMLILEVTLWLPKNTNIISMAKATLGRGGQGVAWITYLLLLYSLLAAYIAGGSDFLKNLLSLVHLDLPGLVIPILFTILLGAIVYGGIHAVDHVNRVLMAIKLLAFVFLAVLIFPHVATSQLLTSGGLSTLSTSTTVAITSFGFATIVPSMRNYFHDNVKQLRIAIIVGSLIPLVCYVIWNFSIMGVIPRDGTNGLISMMHSGRSTSEFVNQLSALLHRDTITSFAHLFTSICLLTSFLGVALCMVDFLADGLQLEKIGKNNVLVCILALLPPLLIVLVKPGIFIAALAYAGIYCVVLLMLLPVLMVWRGRYHKNISKGYRVLGGKVLLGILFLASIVIIGQSIVDMIK